MTLDFFDRIVQQVKHKTKLVSLHVLGDPLCIDNLEEYLLVARKHNIKLDIVSSGIYLDSKHFNILCQDNIHQISFSLDAFFDKNNQRIISSYYNAKDVALQKELYFNKIFSFYEYLQTKSCNIYLNLRLFGNYDYSYILQYFPHFKYQDSKRRIRLATNFFLRFHKKFQWLNTKHIATASNDKVLSHITKYHTNKTSKDLFYTQSNFPNNLTTRHILQDTKKKPYCFGSIRQLAVLADGIVVPCCLDAQGIMQLGDLKVQNLQDILTSNLFIQFQNYQKTSSNLPLICQTCTFRGV